MHPYEICCSLWNLSLSVMKISSCVITKLSRLVLMKINSIFSLKGFLGFFLLLKKREIKKRKSLEFAPKDESSVTQTLIFKAFSQDQTRTFPLSQALAFFLFPSTLFSKFSL